MTTLCNGGGGTAAPGGDANNLHVINVMPAVAENPGVSVMPLQLLVEEKMPLSCHVLDCRHLVFTALNPEEPKTIHTTVPLMVMGSCRRPWSS